jgi:hypothetical protein
VADESLLAWQRGVPGRKGHTSGLKPACLQAYESQG